MKETVHGSPGFATDVFLRVALCSPVQVHYGLLHYLVVMIPTLRIRNYVVLLLIFIIYLLHF